MATTFGQKGGNHCKYKVLSAYKAHGKKTDSIQQVWLRSVLFFQVDAERACISKNIFFLSEQGGLAYARTFVSSSWSCSPSFESTGTSPTICIMRTRRCLKICLLTSHPKSPPCSAKRREWWSHRARGSTLCLRPNCALTCLTKGTQTHSLLPRVPAPLWDGKRHAALRYLFGGRRRTMNCLLTGCEAWCSIEADNPNKLRCTDTGWETVCSCDKCQDTLCQRWKRGWLFLFCCFPPPFFIFDIFFIWVCWSCGIWYFGNISLRVLFGFDLFSKRISPTHFFFLHLGNTPFS